MGADHLIKSFIVLLTAIVCGDSGRVPLREREVDCYAQEKVYHEETGKCYRLLTKGPCEEGEWLVLLREDAAASLIRPICARERCKEGEYYWPATRSCVESKDKAALCGDTNDEQLANNVFGEGECSCAKEPPGARLGGDRNKPCYQLYTRGPCREGQVVALPRGETTRAACVTDACHKEAVKMRKSKSLGDGILAPYENGTCYELGTRGPCPEDLIFKVHATLLKPTCASLTTTIFSLQKPQNCYQDENGDCQKRVVPNKRGDAEKYKEELLNSLMGRS